MRWRPTPGERYTPTRPADRVTANVAALRLLGDIDRAGRPATAEEQVVLARWSGWGAVPAVFDEADDRFAWARRDMQALVSDEEWAAARRTVLNAHYTDPTVVAAMWSALGRLGLTAGRLLEPGCGSFHCVELSHRPRRLSLAPVRHETGGGGVLRIGQSGARATSHEGVELTASVVAQDPAICAGARTATGTRPP